MPGALSFGSGFDDDAALDHAAEEAAAELVDKNAELEEKLAALMADKEALQVRLEEEQAARWLASEGAVRSYGEVADLRNELLRRRSTRPSANDEAMLGALQAIVGKLSPDSESNVTLWDYEWCRASKDSVFSEFNVEVDKSAAAKRRPDPAQRESFRQFLERSGNKSLLKPYMDKLSFEKFIHHHRDLLQYLYVLALTQKSAEAGDDYVRRSLYESLEHFSTNAQYSKLGEVRLLITADTSATELLRAIERAFVPVTRSAAMLGYEQATRALTISNGVKPSAALSRLTELAASHLGREQSHPQVWSEVSWRWVVLMQDQVAHHPFVQPIVDKLCDPEFADAADARERWDKFVRRAEATKAFQEGMAAVAASKPADRGTDKGAGAGRKPQLDRDELRKIFQEEVRKHAGTPPFVGALEQEGGAVLGAGGGGRLGGGGRPSGPPSIGWGSLDWVRTHGVEGKPAPLDPNRPPLHTAAVCKKVGIPLLADMQPAGSFVGPSCPACAFKGNISEWFARPGTPEFAQYGSKIRQPGAKGTAYIHRAERCVVLYEKAHIYARASGDMSVFDPLPAGQDHRVAPG